MGNQQSKETGQFPTSWISRLLLGGLNQSETCHGAGIIIFEMKKLFYCAQEHYEMLRMFIYSLSRYSLTYSTRQIFDVLVFRVRYKKNSTIRHDITSASCSESHLGWFWPVRRPQTKPPQRSCWTRQSSPKRLSEPDLYRYYLWTEEKKKEREMIHLIYISSKGSHSVLILNVTRYLVVHLFWAVEHIDHDAEWASQVLGGLCLARPSWARRGTTHRQMERLSQCDVTSAHRKKQNAVWIWLIMYISLPFSYLQFLHSITW